ncbi:MAG: methyl-accepting chemotaxis protein [Gammaproteobacteria bacterium]|nr:methyl-accepting chemotaxis protein [Gammaproteobacteria bacterium]
MNFLKRISIQRQLVFLAGFVAFGMIGLAMISQFTNQQVRDLGQARLTIAQIDVGMLTLRRNEKDFMARRDLKYVEKFSTNFDNMLIDVDRLKSNLENHGVDSSETDQLKRVFQSYQASFMQVATTVEKIGLDPKSGMYGALRKAVHDAESILKRHNEIQLTADMLMLRRREKDFMLRMDMKYLDKFNKDIAVFDKHLAESGLSASGSASGDVAKAMKAYQANFKALVDGHLALGLSSKEGLHGEMRKTIHQSETLLEEFEQRTNELIDSQASFLVSLQYIVSAVLVVLIMALIALIIPTILRPLRAMSALMLDTSENWDMTAAAHEDVPAEIAHMASSFNAMMSAFRKMIRNVKTSSSKLSDSAQDMASITHAMDNGVTRQQQETEQLANAMDEMSAAVQEVASNAATAAEAAVTADEEGKKGLEVIDKTESGISTLADEFSETAQIIGELSEESDNIGTVLNVIRGIAEQTNLLALNAAIEAARAGEQGRGFAVVADEVRTLAQRSQESTEEIQTIVERLQSTAESAVSAMTRSKQGTETNVEQSRQAAQTLHSIIDAVSKIKDMNLSIATASEEQAAVSTEINTSVKNINEVTTETAQNSQQTISAGKSLNEISTDMNNLVKDFKVE